MSLISFIRHVRKQHPASLDQPLLVHCSAGVGRTGTFILLDVMMQQMTEEGTFSVHQFIRTMRSQRMKMVQTLVSLGKGMVYISFVIYILGSSASMKNI